MNFIARKIMIMLLIGGALSYLMNVQQSVGEEPFLKAGEQLSAEGQLSPTSIADDRTENLGLT